MAEPAPFHDRDGLIWLDGKLVPWREANIHVLTHALHYGSAVFEGERAYNGAIFKLSEHSQRLLDSAKALDFEIPYTVAEIDQICRDVVAANKLSDCYIRPIAWRGSEQIGNAQARVAIDEMQHAVMCSAQSILGQHRVGLAREVAIGEKQQLDSLPHRLLLRGGLVGSGGIGGIVYVSHIDLFGNLRYKPIIF
jgi:hypothetical protein